MHSTPTRVITVVFPVLTLLALGNYAGSQLFGESGRPTFVSLPSKAISESGSKELERLPLINNLEIKRATTSSLDAEPEIARPRRDVVRLKVVAESKPPQRKRRTSATRASARARRGVQTPARVATRPTPLVKELPSAQQMLPSTPSTELQPSDTSGPVVATVQPSLVEHLFRPRHRSVDQLETTPPPFQGDVQVEKKQPAPVVVAVPPIPMPDETLSEPVDEPSRQPVVVVAPDITLPQIVEEGPLVDVDDEPASNPLMVDAPELEMDRFGSLVDLTDTPLAFPIVNPFTQLVTRPPMPTTEPRPTPMVIQGYPGTKMIGHKTRRPIVEKPGVENHAVEQPAVEQPPVEQPIVEPAAESLEATPVIPHPVLNDHATEPPFEVPLPADEPAEATISDSERVVGPVLRQDIVEPVGESATPDRPVMEPETPALPETPAFRPVLLPEDEPSNAEVSLQPSEAPVIPQESLSADPELPTATTHQDEGGYASLESATEPNSSWQPVDLKTVELKSNASQAATPTKATEAVLEDRLLAKKAVLHGFELAQRRAQFSARARFIETLRIVARSLDEQSYGTNHSKALRHALNAYDEAADFFPRSYRPDEDVNLHMAIGGHNTKLLQQADPDLLTPNQCAREYLAYAEQEFVTALGKDAFGAQALYGLGRLELSVETTASNAEMLRAHRSMVLYQAALRVDPKNFAAANELGVLLARYGKYEDAIAALKHCLAYSSQSTAWINLASVYRKVGRMEEAQVALMQAGKVRGRDGKMPFIANRPRVEWVDAATFANAPHHSTKGVTVRHPAQQQQIDPRPRQQPVPQGPVAARPGVPTQMASQPPVTKPDGVRLPVLRTKPTRTATRPRPRYFGFGR